MWIEGKAERIKGQTLSKRSLTAFIGASGEETIMIVKPTQEGWELIYQRAHGLLAMQLAYSWRVDQRPQRWVETLAAIEGHDDEGNNLEGENHLTEAGAPRNFTLSEFSLEQARRVAMRSQYRGRWVALLTSMHTVFLYGSARGKNGEIDAFLDEQIENQARWRKELKVTKGEAEAAYAIMQWCDQLSLVLCQDHLPAGGRWLEVSRGPDGTRYDVRQREDGSLEVAPWPFMERRLTVSVEATRVEGLGFASDEALLEAMRTGRIVVKSWDFTARAD